MSKHNESKRFFYQLALFIIVSLVLIGTVSPLIKLFSWDKAGAFLKKYLFVRTQTQVNSPPSFQDKIKLALSDRYQVSEIESASGGVRVLIEPDMTVWFSESMNLESELRSLQILTSKATIEERRIKKVDFRFSKIVIEY